MSTKRKSAFSVYKMQQKAAKKDENVQLNETENSSFEMDKHQRNGKQLKASPLASSPLKKSAKKDSLKETATESNEEAAKGTKPFSRASRIRHSIGNIGLNKKRRKTKKADEQGAIDETDSDKEVKRARRMTISSSSEVDKTLSSNNESDVTAVTQQNETVSNKKVGNLPRKTFEWLISPVKTDKFFSDLWENKPLLVKRHESNYYEGIFNTNEMDRILRENNIEFSVNLDVTTYKDGQRETHNPAGRALAPVVWDFYQNGCSVRLLNPQTFSESVWKLNSTLQGYFGSFVGANVYLTPPNTQGFAPHYDDIEAFILQLEGKKHWRLYNPRKDEEILPRCSSSNLSEKEIGNPILDVVLEAGDLLYFPRGTIHQADTMDGPHSLHITLSTYQKTSWGDFMEQLVPRALQIAINEDVEFRRGLPLRYLNSTGVANSESTSKERSEFLRHAEQLLMKLVSYLPVDGAVDQMGIKNIHDSLPPVLTKEEKKCSIYGIGARWDDGQVVDAVSIDENTALRLVRKEAIRLVSDENAVIVYHNLENSRTYHELEPQSIEFTSEASAVIEHMMKIFPNFVKVQDLPGDDLDYKIDLLTMLFEKGILITKEPLKPKLS